MSTTFTMPTITMTDGATAITTGARTTAVDTTNPKPRRKRRATVRGPGPPRRAFTARRRGKPYV